MLTIKLLFNFINFNRRLPASCAVDFVRDTGALKMQDRKMQDLKMQDQIAGDENAGPENAGPNRRA